MFRLLAAVRPVSVRVILGVLMPMIMPVGIAGMVLVKLLGAVLAFELLTLAGNSGERDRHHHQGKKFHRGAS